MPSDPTNIIPVTPEPEVTLFPSEEDVEVIRAGKYLMLKDQNKTVEEIANEFGWTSRTTMYSYVEKWKKSGAMEKAWQLFLQPKAEAISTAVSKVLDAWPRILAKQVETALDSSSPRTSLEAAAWLKANVVNEALAAQVDEGASESAYATKRKELLPNIISVPKFLTP